ncbi:general secretion pathway protein GspB [Shewanella salipaludis]|uniref:General secretion pathway protein GspB n=1 Tax=Shewanella salipaludis TaxID=2723052 RepID=A0A972JJ47_9GAMM|nr:general secretion pathway protein GspB [Shewanella salipaludis]NMH65753.1 general secretion pathway protein GspB [Shewanella salipaludis]
MSILLDAVMRSKQQVPGSLPDVVLTPRAEYREAAPRGVGAGRLGLLALAIAVGIGAAWGLSQLRGPAAGAQFNHSADPAVTSQTGARPSPHLSQELSPELSTELNNKELSTALSTQELSAQPAAAPESKNSGVRLAGRVALPLAQPLIRSAATAPVSGTSSGALSDTSSGNPMSAAIAPGAAYAQQLPLPVSAANAYDAVDEPGDEPIMLGANANRRGLSELEALRRQVSAAAVDVGLETVQSREEDNLVAAFQTALKDVEYEHAASKPVSAPELDPIVAPKADAIPSYGQLPAGVQLRVPEFSINAHVYSSEPAQRWLNVDGAELQEGDSIKGSLRIVEIRPRDVILELEGHEFKVPAI